MSLVARDERVKDMDKKVTEEEDMRVCVFL